MLRIESVEAPNSLRHAVAVRLVGTHEPSLLAVIIVPDLRVIRVRREEREGVQREDVEIPRRHQGGGYDYRPRQFPSPAPPSGRSTSRFGHGCLSADRCCLLPFMSLLHRLALLLRGRLPLGFEVLRRLPLQFLRGDLLLLSFCRSLPSYFQYPFGRGHK